jgi:uncharacterized protein (TIGR02145 family)
MQNTFIYRLQSGGFWTSTQTSATAAHSYHLASNNSAMQRYGDNKQIGFSIRCLKD